MPFNDLRALKDLMALTLAIEIFGNKEITLYITTIKSIKFQESLR
jgi:hypothetical protein